MSGPVDAARDFGRQLIKAPIKPPPTTIQELLTDPDPPPSAAQRAGVSAEAVVASRRFEELEAFAAAKAAHEQAQADADEARWQAYLARRKREARI
jgi:hypothetical protein